MSLPNPLTSHVPRITYSAILAQPESSWLALESLYKLKLVHLKITSAYFFFAFSTDGRSLFQGFFKKK